MTMPAWMFEIGISDILDIVFMTVLIYIFLVWFRRTRAAFVMTGIFIIAVIYLLARQFDLVLTARVLQAFFAVILIAIVVIFQEELRHFFEQVALWSFRRRLGRRPRAVRLSRPEVQTLVRTLSDFSREKIGALIVIRGKNLLIGKLDGGEELDGKISEPLLKSIFDPHSIGHDGAMIIEKDRITQFGCHLPLSKNIKNLEHTGTRHSAALGLAELTDALCIIVSEERGTISIARNGSMRHVRDNEDLDSTLENFYQEVNPLKQKQQWHDIFKRNYRQKAAALALAMLLWFVHDYGEEHIYNSYAVPVTLSKIPEPWQAAEIEPEEVYVTFSGPRKAFYFLGRKSIHLLLKIRDIKEGSEKIRLSSDNLSFPEDLILESMDTNLVKIRFEKKAETEAPDDKKQEEKGVE